MNLAGYIRPEYQSWLKLWLIAFILLFLGKAYEFNYIYLGHDHGHVIQRECQEEIKQIEKAHFTLLKEIPKFKDDFSELENILGQLDSYTKSNPQFEKHHIQICLQNKLIYWNQKESYYDPGWCPCNNQNGKGFFSEEGKNYFGLKSPITLGDTVVCLIEYKQLLTNTILPDGFSITNERTNTSQYKLVDQSNHSIGFIDNTGQSLSTNYANALLISYLIILLILFIPFHIYTKYFFTQHKFDWGIMLWITGVIMTISLSQWMVHDTDFYDSVLTHSKIKTSFKEYTFFEFLVTTAIFFHLAYILNNYMTLSKSFVASQGNKLTHYLIPYFNYIAILLCLSIYCTTFKSIFSNSDFYLDLDRLVFMPVENYFLILSLVLILLSIFLITHKLNLSTISFELSLRKRIAIQLIAFISFSFLFKFLQLEINTGTFLVSTFIIILLQDFFIDYKQNNILWLISWIIIVSFLTSGLVFHYQNIKSRNIKNNLIESIDAIKYQTIDSSENSFSADLSSLIKSATEKNLELFIFEGEIRKYSNSFNSPDLIWAKRNLGSESKVNARLNTNEFLISRIDPNYTILIGHQIPSLVKAVSLFSYLFTALILLSYFISLINQKYKILPESLSIQISDKPSLRNRIQFYVILSIVISFLTIAIITVFFTKKSEEEITKANLHNKLKYLSQTLERSVQNYTNIDDALLTIKNQISDSYSLFDYKIQFFQNKGFELSLFRNNIISDSKTRLIDPDFYFKHSAYSEDIVHSKYTNDQGRVKLSALKNILLNNQRVGTLKMSTEINSDSTGDSRLANLINTLLNIYVFLFLISASLATFLANSITSPLEELSNRLKRMRLGKINEPLEWSGQDEIGELIKDYNKMVDQLDESVALLAKSERDSAWREMARQVAHEIKNPLTPMKLNIQYLQQQFRSENYKDSSDLVRTVSDSILEQIDGLTKIATEFSNFAQMPKASNERILLNDLISSVHDLFRKRDDIDIKLTIPIDELFVFCDRTQVVRVLNNLINNAIQAIPDDRRGKIDIRLYTRGNKAIITIEDNGIGIPEEMKDKIFLPNFTTKTSGTGLGLAMCMQIIESVNGSISFESQLNKGTIFTVSIPIMKQENE